LHGLSGGWADPAKRASRRLANICVRIFEGLGKRWHGGWADLYECVSRRLANIYVLIFEGLGKRRHGISGSWADPPN
jgi:hypothetical protein